MTIKSSPTPSNTLSDEWKDVQRILAIRLDNIGDVIMLGPSLRTIHENLPGRQITLMASPVGSQAAELLPWVDDVFPWASLWQELNNRFGLDPEREFNFINKLREEKFDAAIIFTSFSQSPYPPAYVCYLAGIPIRVGHSYEFGGGVLSHWFKPPPDGEHQAERNLYLLKSAGFLVKDRNLSITIPAEAQKAAVGLLQNLGIKPGDSYIYFAPGASAESRRYNPARSARAATLLARDTGYPVLIAATSREAENLKTVLDICDGQNVISLAGKTTLAEAAALISGASLVVAMNSASLHIADAFQLPMVILYSGTEYLTEWEPRQSPAILLNRDVSCAPCRKFWCPYNKECLDFTPEEVLRAAVQLLSTVEVEMAKQVKL